MSIATGIKVFDDIYRAVTDLLEGLTNACETGVLAKTYRLLSLGINRGLFSIIGDRLDTLGAFK